MCQQDYSSKIFTFISITLFIYLTNSCFVPAIWHSPFISCYTEKSVQPVYHGSTTLQRLCRYSITFKTFFSIFHLYCISNLLSCYTLIQFSLANTSSRFSSAVSLSPNEFISSRKYSFHLSSTSFGSVCV